LESKRKPVSLVHHATGSRFVSAGAGHSHARATTVWVVAALAFALPLIPLLLFNLQTGGTVASLFGNLSRSYYGIDNSAYLPNLTARVGQLRSLMLGDFLWYLGELYANPWSQWILPALVVAAAVLCLRRGPRTGDAGRSQWAFLAPVLLLVLVVAQSAFTVSDLFITHYILLLPLIPLAGGLATAAVAAQAARQAWAGRLLAALALAGVLLWGGADLLNTLNYHTVLRISGGNGSHSDGITELARYLDATAPSAPIALDWGMDAPLRYLTGGLVNPVEVFGYASPQSPDDGFAARVLPFFENPDNVYLTHSAEATVFKQRMETTQELAARQGLYMRTEAVIRERSGRPLYVIYRVLDSKYR